MDLGLERKNLSGEPPPILTHMVFCFVAITSFLLTRTIFILAFRGGLKNPNLINLPILIIGAGLMLGGIFMVLAEGPERSQGEMRGII